MMVVRWQFTDPTTSELYVFEINPSEGGTPAKKKNILEQPTTAPDGKTLIFEGAREPEKYSFSGTLLTQSQYDALNSWFEKSHQIQVTDDLGRQFMIYITDLEMTRQRAIHHPYKHSFRVNATILDWP